MKKLIKHILVGVLALLPAIGTLASCKNPQENYSNMKTLIVYFSYSPGNTKMVAQKIHAAIDGSTIAEIETKVPYSTDYSKVTDQGDKEVNEGYKPELKPLGVDLKNFDRIIIGTPTWWYHMAPAVLSFMSSTDFTGKVVVPFQTHAGWPGTTLEDMTKQAKKNGATKVEHAKDIKFSSNMSNLDKIETSEKELSAWIESLK